jgi:hypothetical protein
MMTMNMYTASAPLFERQLANLSTWLDKAAVHAQALRFDSANYLGLRLAPDMLPLSAQVRAAGEIAKLAVARLADIEAPPSPAGEPTLDGLREHVRLTREFLLSVDPQRCAGSDTREIVLPQRGGDPLHFVGETFLQRWALPNFFFHATTAYALLRQGGVVLGKADFLGPLAP